MFVTYIPFVHLTSQSTAYGVHLQPSCNLPVHHHGSRVLKSWLSQTGSQAVLDVSMYARQPYNFCGILPQDIVACNVVTAANKSGADTAAIPDLPPKCPPHAHRRTETQLRPSNGTPIRPRSSLPHQLECLAAHSPNLRRDRDRLHIGHFQLPKVQLLRRL